MIYCVMCSEDFGEGSYLTAVFKNKKKAEKYIEIQNELEQDNGYNYYINEKEFYDKEVSMKTKVASYYNYYINLDEEFCLKECDENNESWEGTEKQRYTCKNYVEVSETCVSGWSVESYEKAREIALNEYYIINDMKHKVRRYKVVRGLFENAKLKSGTYHEYFQCTKCEEVKKKEHFDGNFVCDECRGKDEQVGSNN